MAQASIQETLKVSKDQLMQAVTRYEDYPQFVEGCKRVEVERKAAGQARVKYDVSMMKEVSYVLDHREDWDKGEVTWNLVEGDVIKKNDGTWKIKELGNGSCEVHYSVEVEFSIPAPSFIVNRLIKGTLPSMIKSFEKQAQKYPLKKES